MDAIIKDSLLRCYIVFYRQLSQLNVTLPAPERVAAATATLAQYASAYTPFQVQAIFTKLASAPIQANIVPVFLVLVVLYAIFSAILFTVRGIVRLVYGFVRFTIMIAMVATFLYALQYYYLQENGLSLTMLLDTFFSSPSPPSPLYQQQQTQHVVARSM